MGKLNLKNISQAIRILEMFKKSSDKKVTCSELANVGLYHKGASRMSDLKEKGYVIEFTPEDVWSDGYYTLISEPGQVVQSHKMVINKEGQGEIVFDEERFD